MCVCVCVGERKRENINLVIHRIANVSWMVINMKVIHKIIRRYE